MQAQIRNRYVAELLSLMAERLGILPLCDEALGPAVRSIAASCSACLCPRECEAWLTRADESDLNGYHRFCRNAAALDRLPRRRDFAFMS